MESNTKMKKYISSHLASVLQNPQRPKLFRSNRTTRIICCLTRSCWPLNASPLSPLLDSGHNFQSSTLGLDRSVHTDLGDRDFERLAGESMGSGGRSWGEWRDGSSIKIGTTCGRMCGKRLREPSPPLIPLPSA